MIFKSKYGNISVRQIGVPQYLDKELMGWIYQHTLQVGFKGKRAQFQHFSFYRNLDDYELLSGLKYFIEYGTGTEKGFEQFCNDFLFDTWGFEPDETDSATGYNKKSLKVYRACEKRKAQLERIGITPDMAYDIVNELQVAEDNQVEERLLSFPVGD